MLRYVWDPFIRVFHWSLVGAFGYAFYTHNSLWEQLHHAYAGYVAGSLIVARIIWGLLATGYANFHSFPPNPVWAFKYFFKVLKGTARHYIGHNPIGSMAIYAMLGLGIVTVGSGCIVFNNGWGLIDDQVSRVIHHYATWTWLGVVVVHVLGVLFDSFIHHDNLIWAMITGCKRVCSIDERFDQGNTPFPRKKTR
ncbi:cytochrome b/b6 domain-containing protein [Methylophilus aquaticus]|uniref:Cytochrome b/b6 domain-containing protein n=1 Tax=Methylophilus aquaticus TaxID=1971610 RepID=A0ABT9JNQ7_9PROT|nr:cytochrome b/b6 domain-containing protein [Methylophilus aquaticus]MDP8566239.1 cytochrome b/b6 domain-containing protein [Methylophilus aquaticus]